MKILLLSDTHLENDLFKKITDKYSNYDYMIHCGDSSLMPDDPLLEKYLTVKGNHDEGVDFPKSIVLNDIEGHNILITHGHYQHVYYDYDEIVADMKASNCDICFHGHTHVPHIEKIDNLTLINPGSVMINRGSYGYGTFATVEITKDNIDIHFYNSETYEECGSTVLEDGEDILNQFHEILKDYPKY